MGNRASGIHSEINEDLPDFEDLQNSVIKENIIQRSRITDSSLCSSNQRHSKSKEFENQHANLNNLKPNSAFEYSCIHDFQSIFNYSNASETQPWSESSSVNHRTLSSRLSKHVTVDELNDKYKNKDLRGRKDQRKDLNTDLAPNLNVIKSSSLKPPVGSSSLFGCSVNSSCSSSRSLASSSRDSESLVSSLDSVESLLSSSNVPYFFNRRRIRCQSNQLYPLEESSSVCLPNRLADAEPRNRFLNTPSNLSNAAQMMAPSSASTSSTSSCQSSTEQNSRQAFLFKTMISSLPPWVSFGSTAGSSRQAQSSSNAADLRRPESTSNGLPSSSTSSSIGTGLSSYALLSSLLGMDQECPICHSLVPPDDFELHVVICLTRPQAQFTKEIMNKDWLSAHSECAICLDDLLPDSTVALLDCKCVYHVECIESWFKKKHDCPIHRNCD